MIQLNKKAEEAVKEIAKDLVQENIDTVSKEKVTRVKSFKNYGFITAGQNLGDYLQLKTYLSWIKDGHIVDGTYNENDEQLLRQQAEKKILDKNEEKEKVEGEKRTSSEVSKPFIEQKIKDIKDEIQQTKINLAENKIQTGYEPIKYGIYVSLVLLLSIYLILFYASTIYASFFRNASSLISDSGDDIVLLLDSIFDVSGIFKLSPVLLFVYFGAFLFFAIGLIPHNIQGEYKKLKIGLSIFGALIADSMLAYKIDSGIHNLKVMSGIQDADWHFYSSINFYLVLLFGFCAYLVWGYMLEMMFKEKSKKSQGIKASLIIDGLKAEMKELKIELKKLEERIIELETSIISILSQLSQLKKELENRLQNPNTLSQNLTSFYTGWRQYLNNSVDNEIEKDQCENAFNEYMQSQFHSPILMN